MDEVLGTGRLPENVVGVLLDQFRVTDAVGASIPTELHKGGRIHAFLVRLTAEVNPVPILAGLILLGADHDGEAHILHSFFFCPGRALQPGPSDVWVSRGDALGGAPQNHINPCGLLCRTAQLKCRATVIPHFSPGGSLTLELADDAMQ